MTFQPVPPATVATTLGDDAAIDRVVVPVDRAGRRQHLDSVIDILATFAPARLPKWHGPPSLAELEAYAQDDLPYGDWLESFVRWRLDVSRAHSANIARAEVVLGALADAHVLADWDASSALVTHLVGRWGMREDPPTTRAAQRPLARRLARPEPYAMPARLMTHSWRPPPSGGARGRGL